MFILAVVAAIRHRRHHWNIFPSPIVLRMVEACAFLIIITLALLLAALRTVPVLLFVV
jgi:hypothetical protein